MTTDWVAGKEEKTKKFKNLQEFQK